MNTMATSNSDSKRRRLLCPNSLHLGALPDETLVHVARYLPKAGCALFAVAMTAPGSSWERTRWQLEPSTTSEAIVTAHGTYWYEIDFEDIDEEVASKLTDGDIGGTLKCVCARHNIKSLKLAGCTNITGRCLRPLMLSKVLERIDLSLVGQHENPEIEPTPLISEKFVIPILMSILGGRYRNVQEVPSRDLQRCPLKHVTLPHKFLSAEKSTGKLWTLEEFLERYNGVLAHRETPCAICNGITDYDHFMFRLEFDTSTAFNLVEHKRGGNERFGPWFGVQNYTCYGCLKYFPPKGCCECDFGANMDLKHCFECKKHYCQDCVTMDYCNSCERYSCNNCEAMVECFRCWEKMCEDCEIKCDTCNLTSCGCEPYLYCNGECEPQKEHCHWCAENEARKDCDIKNCDSCDYPYCEDCRYNECKKNWKEACTGCVEMIHSSIGPKMAEENQKLLEENRKLAEENKRLRRESRLRKLLE